MSEEVPVQAVPVEEVAPEVATEQQEAPAAAEETTTTATPAVVTSQAPPPPPQQPQQRLSAANKVYVKDIPSAATEEEIKELFSRAGDVVDLLVREVAGKPLKYAFVGYATLEEVATALTLHGKEIAGGPIGVEAKQDRVCFRCNKPGHLATKCRNDPVCRQCGKSGHMQRDCGRVNQNGGGFRDRSGNNAGRVEHSRREDDRNNRDRRDRSRERRRRRSTSSDESRDRRRRRRSPSSSDEDRNRRRHRRDDSRDRDDKPRRKDDDRKSSSRRL